MQKILVIQTAFIGDVVLATGLLEKLHNFWPDASLDILVRKGNESLFIHHPFLHKVIVWDKSNFKYYHLFKILYTIRDTRYDVVINVQRFAASGFLTAFSRAKKTIGFDKNPLSFLFSIRIQHLLNVGDSPVHEIERNHQLISFLTDEKPAPPRLYPSLMNDSDTAKWKQKKYLCIAPASVWFTKQYPANQWTKFISVLPKHLNVYLIGAPTDHELCENIRLNAHHPSVINLAGQLNFLESASLMKEAVMNYVNDSAPLHFASAVNAPVTAIYCSTLPAFGFGPLSDNRNIVEVKRPLSCRPCGFHGRKNCPLSHFHCAEWITNEQLLSVLPD